MGAAALRACARSRVWESVYEVVIASWHDTNMQPVVQGSANRCYKVQFDLPPRGGDKRALNVCCYWLELLDQDQGLGILFIVVADSAIDQNVARQN